MSKFIVETSARHIHVTQEVLEKLRSFRKIMWRRIPINIKEGFITTWSIRFNNKINY